MRAINGFAGASHICDSCLSVWFVLSDAVISRVALAGAVRGWQAVRAFLTTEAVDAIADHPAVREYLASPDVETDVFRRDALEIIEHAVAALAPVIRTLDQEGGGS
jgi:hypothetical protein